MYQPMKASRGHKPVSSAIYDTEYFLTELEGWSEFKRTKGRVLPDRLSYCLEVGSVRPGMKVLDAGFGRGELLLHCCRAGAHAFGIDYSAAAVDVGSEIVRNATEHDVSLVDILRADIKHLPFPDDYFDRVFVLDVVEHLHSWELDEALREIHRTLAPRGQLVIHTMPNRWYYAIGYPLYRAFQRLRGKRLPHDPHQRYKYMPSVHVNEQDPLSLRRVLERNNFSAKVWLWPVDTSSGEADEPDSRVKYILSTVFPLKFVFCSSIFAIAQRNGARRPPP